MPAPALTKLDRDASVYLGGRLLAGLGALLLIPVLSRSLGPELYGRYGYLMALALVVAQLSSGWLHQAILRFYSSTDSGQLRTGIFRPRLLAGFTAFGILFLSALLVGEGVYVATILGGFGLVWAWHTTQMAITQAALQPLRASIADSLRVYIPLAGIALWLWFRPHLGLEGALLLLTLGLAGSAFMLSGAGPSTSIRSERANGTFSADAWFRYGAPLGVWMGLASLQFFIGRAVLQHFSDGSSLGLFTALQDLSSKGMGLLMIPLLHALSPRLMQAWSALDFDLALRLFRRALVLAAVILLLMVLMAALLGEFFLQVLFDSDVQELLPMGLNMTSLVVLMLWSEGLGALGLFTHKGYELAARTLNMVYLLLLSIALNGILLIIIITTTGGITLMQVLFALLASRMVYLVSSLLATILVLRSAYKLSSQSTSNLIQNGELL